MTHPSSDNITMISSDCNIHCLTPDGSVALDDLPKHLELGPDLGLAQLLLVLECQPRLVSHGDTDLICFVLSFNTLKTAETS